MYELGTAWLTIRANVAGLAEEVGAGVSEALEGAQAQIADFAAAQVDAASDAIQRNMELAASYKEIGDAADDGSVQQQAAYKLAEDAAKAASDAMVESTSAVTDSIVEQVAEQKAASAEWGSSADVAKAAADETVGAIDSTAVAAKAAADGIAEAADTAAAAQAKVADAAKGAGAEGVTAADATVGATVKQIEELRVLAATYKEVAAAAVRGSDTQMAASKLAADTTAAADAKIGLSGAAAGEGLSAGGILGGLKSHLLNFGTLLGVGIGADVLVHLTKDAVNAASGVQKSMEIVKEEFGSSAHTVNDFVNNSALGLGETKDVAAATAGQFGLIFHTMKINQSSAATMAVGWQQLVGAIAQMKGVDPTTLMSKITLAAEGNMRGLKQLGITFTTAQLQTEAFAQGTIRTKNQALDPAEKSMALYGLAIKLLPGYLADAKKHSGDLANEVVQLKAAFGDAEEEIGKALMPTVTRLIGDLARWITKLTEGGKLQRDTNAAIKDAGVVFHTLDDILGPIIDKIKDLVHDVGGLGNAVKIMVAAWGAWKIASLVSGIAGLTKGLLGITGAAEGAEGAIGGLSLAGAGILGAAGLGVAGVYELMTKTGAAGYIGKNLGKGLFDLLGGGSSIPDITKLPALKNLTAWLNNLKGSTGAVNTVKTMLENVATSTHFSEAQKEPLIREMAKWLSDGAKLGGLAIPAVVAGELTSTSALDSMKKAGTTIGTTTGKAAADALAGTTYEAQLKAMQEANQQFGQNVSDTLTKAAEAWKKATVTFSDAMTNAKIALQLAITAHSQDVKKAVADAQTSLTTLAESTQTTIQSYWAKVVSLGQQGIAQQIKTGTGVANAASQALERTLANSLVSDKGNSALLYHNVQAGISAVDSQAQVSAMQANFGEAINNIALQLAKHQVSSSKAVTEAAGVFKQYGMSPAELAKIPGLGAAFGAQVYAYMKAAGTLTASEMKNIPKTWVAAANKLTSGGVGPAIPDLAQKVSDIARTERDALVNAKKALADAQVKNKEDVANAKTALQTAQTSHTETVAKESLAVTQHSHSELVKQTALQTKIAAATAASAAASGNGTIGFRTSANNRGHAASNAREAAKARS